MATIVTHPGRAHRDDFLSCALLVAAQRGITRIERREPTQEDLESSEVYVVDTGGRHEPGRRNFDHHQYGRDHGAVCALSQVMAHLGVYDLAQDILPWMSFTEVLDSKGPRAASKFLGASWGSVLQALSPIEEVVLNLFAQREFVFRGEFLWELLSQIGESILKKLRETADRLERLSGVSKIEVIKGLKVLDVSEIPRTQDPTLAVNMFRNREAPEAAISLSLDDRGEGFTLYRFDDHPAVDFSRLEGHPAVVFAHKGGFIAKTGAGVSRVEALDLIATAIKEV